ncbi:MAG: restriction endonuclease subunit S [Vulcanimicrobiota bacterium]
MSLPTGWQLVELGELGKWATGGTPSRSVPEYFGGGIPWVKTGDLDDGPVVTIEETISELGLKNSNAKLFPPGTLLVALYGATIGKLGILVSAAACNQACAALLPGSTALVVEYLFWYLRSRREDLRAAGQGGAQPNISQGLLKAYKCPLPPVNEQRRIVARIEELQGRSRAARESLEAIPPLLERFRQSVLAAAFRGDLTADWRRANPDVEPASVLLERIRVERRRRWEEAELERLRAKGREPKDDKWRTKYREPEPVDTTGLRKLPEGWAWIHVAEVADVVDPHPSHRTPPVVSGGVPYVGMGDFRSDGTLDLEGARKVSPNKLRSHRERYRLQSGDFIFGKIGTLGTPIELPQPFDYCVSANVILLQPVSEVNSRWLLHYLDSPYIGRILADLSRATAQPAFGITKMRQLAVPIPSRAEQDFAVRLIDSHLERSLVEGDALKVAAISLERLDQSILVKAHRGELVPQDPDDESASALLERIRGEDQQVPTKPRRNSFSKRGTLKH